VNSIFNNLPDIREKDVKFFTQYADRDDGRNSSAEGSINEYDNQ